jgi:hypothetical protein
MREVLGAGRGEQAGKAIETSDGGGEHYASLRQQIA